MPRRANAHRRRPCLASPHASQTRRVMPCLCQAMPRVIYKTSNRPYFRAIVAKPYKLASVAHARSTSAALICSSSNVTTIWAFHSGKIGLSA